MKTPKKAPKSNSSAENVLMENTPPVIDVQNLIKNYKTEAGEIEVLKKPKYQRLARDFVALMGPSGSGKSTFMRYTGLSG